MMTQHASGVVQAIAHRPTDGEPMREIAECRVLVGRGLDSENRPDGKRSVTLLSAESWGDVCRELGVPIPWHTRRANFLISGMDLASLIGRTITIGEIRVLIHAETKPCKLMDEQHFGLRETLVPHFRGGVYGQTLSEGTIRVGDQVMLAH